ncbi:unnamed protein product [Euphydryas editha]|uniref:Uncharacterized protein n=1 Tax=Euphydryas editha TaxID=104508 RepID=A0AAU9THG0_EUPED|nr:unnamed protein product [Euphydryas editha]
MRRQNTLRGVRGNRHLSLDYWIPEFQLQSERDRVNDVSFDKNGWVHNATNIAYQGLDDAILDDFGFNLVTKFAHLTFHTDMDVTYSYTSCGTVFSKLINGEGLAKVSIKNFQFGLSMPFDIKEINGKKFIDLKGVNSWYQIRDKAVFNFENLYNGNKEQSEAIHNLFNKNWKFVAEEFGKDFSEKLVDGIFYKLKNYMLTMPLKDFATC